MRETIIIIFHHGTMKNVTTKVKYLYAGRLDKEF